jgi:redox-sensing transcriptional repressor
MARPGRKGGALPSRPVPSPAVTRLSLYLRQAELMMAQGIEFASSEELGRALGISSAQVRRDLGMFGHHGLRGQGYRCADLARGIRRTIGTDRRWPVALAGFGNLGRALVGYPGFRARGFDIVAVFDVDPAKIGARVDGRLVVEPAARMSERIRALGIQLGIIAVPAVAAQSVAAAMTAGGILNFAPTPLAVPDDVCVISVDLTVELESLVFLVQWHSQRK